jgi:hypothetical protein
MMTGGDKDGTDFWQHLYESCDPNICVWCQTSQEFIRWHDMREIEIGKRVKDE